MKLLVNNLTNFLALKYNVFSPKETVLEVKEMVQSVISYQAIDASQNGVKITFDEDGYRH